MKISEILQMQEAMPIMDLEGNIDGVYEFKESDFEGKPQTRQSLKISDNTGSIYVQLKNIPKIEFTKKGQSIILSSVHNKKFGLLGAKVNRYMSTKTGKEVTQIVVTPSCKLVIGDINDNQEQLPLPKKQETKTVIKETSRPQQVLTTDWNAKEQREYLCRLYNTGIMTLAPILLQGKTVNEIGLLMPLLKQLSKEVTEMGFSILYGNTNFSPPDSHDVREMTAQNKSENQETETTSDAIEEEIPF